MPFSLGNKVCLITGASGIAAATAVLAAQAGARIFFAANVEEQCRALDDSLRDAGAESEFLIADLSNPTEAAAAVQNCLKRFGRIDCELQPAGGFRCGPREPL